MSNSKDRHRGARRLAGALVSTALVGAGAIATTGVAYAEESTPEGVLESFNAKDFVTQAAELPAGLHDAIKRDLGISAEQYLANAHTAKSASDVAANLEADGVGVAGVAIDGQDVTLYVSTEADVEAAAAVGAKVEVGEPPAPDHSDQEFEPKADHKGGYGYGIPVEAGATNFYRCSVGFSGYSPEGTDRFLTAGHCGLDLNTYEEFDLPAHHLELDAPVGSGSAVLGAGLGTITPGSMTFGPSVHHDGGLVDITGDFTGQPQVAGWDGGNGAPDAQSVTIYDSIDAVVGAQACKSGSTSGWTCGEVLAAEETITYTGTEDVVTGFIFGACVLRGDSGGAVVVGNFALGVNSGSSFKESCNEPGKSSLGYAVSSGQYNAMDRFGDQWELNVAVNTPAVNKVVATEEGATLRGTVDKAGNNHRVTVTVDGVGDFDADVNAEGKFAIEIDQPLEAGTEHTYSAQAFYGNHSQSEVATGSFTVEEEVQVAELVVSSPTDGQTTGNPRPPFEGTGEPGAEVALTVGDTELGAVTVGDDGNWSLKPESDLPKGVRFDATVTQTAGDDVQEATVADLGVKLPDITVTAPEDGSETTPGVYFEGTSFPGASVSLTLTPASETESAPAFSATSDEAAAADDEDLVEWEGHFNIDDDGNWRFIPSLPLEEGEYTVTAMATLEDGDPELASSETTVSFTVIDDTVGEDGNEGDGDEDLPDTGSSSLPIILIGVGLLAAGGAAFAIRRRNANVS